MWFPPSPYWTTLCSSTSSIQSKDGTIIKIGSCPSQTERRALDYTGPRPFFPATRFTWEIYKKNRKVTTAEKEWKGWWGRWTDGVIYRLLIKIWHHHHISGNRAKGYFQIYIYGTVCLRRSSHFLEESVALIYIHENGSGKSTIAEAVIHLCKVCFFNFFSLFILLGNLLKVFIRCIKVSDTVHRILEKFDFSRRCFLILYFYISYFSCETINRKC